MLIKYQIFASEKNTFVIVSTYKTVTDDSDYENLFKKIASTGDSHIRKKSSRKYNKVPLNAYVKLIDGITLVE